MCTVALKRIISYSECTFDIHFCFIFLFQPYPVQKLAVKCLKIKNFEFLPNFHAAVSSPRIFTFYSFFPLKNFVWSLSASSLLFFLSTPSFYIPLLPTEFLLENEIYSSGLPRSGWTYISKFHTVPPHSVVLLAAKLKMAGVFWRIAIDIRHNSASNLTAQTVQQKRNTFLTFKETL